MRAIKGIYKAEYEPIADLITYRAMPTHELPINTLDPFIFLNHHGYQEYLPHNAGLPFGPHPHRGFETVTFILQGDLTHKDNSGANSVIQTGGIQWMTAGSGIVHSETSSKEFRDLGGPLEILQLWINLAAKDKVVPPAYTGLQKDEIPELKLDNGNATVHVIAGQWQGITGPVKPLTDISLSYVNFKENARVEWSVATSKNILFYVARGALSVNGTDVHQHHMVEFGHDDEKIVVHAQTDAVILFGYATPFNEPFMAYGPFVMNTREEILQSYDDYNKGKFGSEDLLR